MLDHETYTRGEKLFLVKALARVVEVYAFAFARRIDLDGGGEVCGETELKEKVGTEDAIVNDIDM